MVKFLAVVDILIMAVLSLLECLLGIFRQQSTKPFVSRLLQVLIRRLLSKSKGRPIAWLRLRQSLLRSAHPDEKNVVFDEWPIAGVSCLHCRPKDGEIKRVLVYFHGGGYVTGSAEATKNTIAPLALKTQALVVSVDYRLAPEHPFPAAHEDSFRVTLALFQQYPDKAIFLCGDSAGGALALSTSLALSKASPQYQARALVLLSPWVNPFEYCSQAESLQDRDIIDNELIQGWLAQLDVVETDLESWCVDFSQQSLLNLPEIFMQWSKAEIFSQQIEQFCQRAQEQGVSVTLDSYNNQFHVFQTLSPLVTEAKLAVDNIAAYIHSQDLSP